VRHAAYLSLIIGVLFIAAILTFGYWGIARLLHPLYTLKEAAQALARGEWPEVPETQRADEVGLLARAFDLMTRRLRETLDGLQRNEAYLADAQRLSHTGSWAWDPVSRQTHYWSEELFRMFGFDPGQGIPSSEAVAERVHPDDLVEVREVLQKGVREKVD